MAADAGGGYRLFAEVDLGRVVVYMSAVHHTAMIVVGVLAAAGVGHQDHVRHGVIKTIH